MCHLASEILSSLRNGIVSDSPLDLSQNMDPISETARLHTNTTGLSKRGEPPLTIVSLFLFNCVMVRPWAG